MTAGKPGIDPNVPAQLIPPPVPRAQASETAASWPNSVDIGPEDQVDLGRDQKRHEQPGEVRALDREDSFANACAADMWMTMLIPISAPVVTPEFTGLETATVWSDFSTTGSDGPAATQGHDADSPRAVRPGRSTCRRVVGGPI